MQILPPTLLNGSLLQLLQSLGIGGFAMIITGIIQTIWLGLALKRPSPPISYLIVTLSALLHLLYGIFETTRQAMFVAYWFSLSKNGLGEGTSVVDGLAEALLPLFCGTILSIIFTLLGIISYKLNKQV